MSFIKKNSNSASANVCSCQETPSDAKFRLTIEPEQLDVREHPKHDEVGQLANAERVQQLFLPHLSNLTAHKYGDGYHVHPDQPGKVAHMDQLHSMLDQYGLCARVSLQRGGDHNAVAASLERDHVAELLENGVADVKVPLSDSTFRLHSTQSGRITAVEFVAQ